MYIRAAASISPQKTWSSASLLSEPVDYKSNRLACIEPDYKEFLDVKLLRRMSRIIRMGVAAATACLKQGNVEVPDAIVTGTAYGCLEDTGLFLNKMLEQGEELLAPTAFIQSTHNTIGAQIALLLQCNGYNNTFVHRGISFESALLDSLLLLEENDASYVLVGGVDEITDISHAILSRLGLYKREPKFSLDLFEKPSKGTIAGEGAAFFLLASRPSASDYAWLAGTESFYKPDSTSEVESRVLGFLQTHSVDIEDIDLIIMGTNGDTKGDQIYHRLSQSVFRNSDLVPFKHLCGEYPTVASFAVWLAASIIKANAIPAVLGQGSGKRKKINKVLIYNHYLNLHHSLFLLSAC